MALCDSYVSNLECVIDLDNTLTYKLAVLGLLLLYSFFALYIYRKYETGDDMFKLLKSIVFRGAAYTYLTFLPFLLLMLRHSVSFETFLLLLAAFYIIVAVIGLSLGLLFSWNRIKGLYSKNSVDGLRERYKYRNG